MSSSYTLTIPPIAGCFDIAASFIEKAHGVRSTWQPRNGNDLQKRLLEACAEIDLSKIPEIESIADLRVDVVNAWLIKKGFDIQLNPCAPPSFYTGSVLDLLLKWSRPGTETRLHDGEFKAARITDHFGVYRISSTLFNHVAQLTCDNGDRVYMMSCRERTVLALDLRDFVLGIEKNLELTSDYAAVVFPHVKFEEYPDISWLAGVNPREDGVYETETGPGLTYCVAEAKQQTRFAMDHVGAHVESAAAIAFIGSGCMLDAEMKPDFVINEQFVLWVRREGVNDPIFIGHFFEDSWVRS